MKFWGIACVVALLIVVAVVVVYSGVDVSDLLAAKPKVNWNS